MNTSWHPVGLFAIVMAALAAFTLPLPAAAYTGGPVRVLGAIGYDPTEAKIFYRTMAYDESGKPPQAWFHELDGPDPARPVRAPSLEGTTNDARGSWARLSKRLVTLRCAPQYELNLAVIAESTGVARYQEVPCYEVRITVQATGGLRELTREAFCDPLVRVRGLYEIPGRFEKLVVLSRIGRAYGCEEVDEVIVVQGAKTTLPQPNWPLEPPPVGRGSAPRR